MKLLIATLALATVIAVPAFAQSDSYTHRAQQSQFVRGNNLNTQAGRSENVQRHSTNPAHDVYFGGRYVGSDPDERIRLELLRDHTD